MRISGRVDKSRNGRLRRAWLDCQPGQKERKREGKRERKKERKKKNDSFRWLVSARPIDRPSKSIRFYLMNRAEMKKNLFLFCAFFFGRLVCCFSFTIFFPVQVAPFFFFKKKNLEISNNKNQRNSKEKLGSHWTFWRNEWWKKNEKRKWKRRTTAVMRRHIPVAHALSSGQSTIKNNIKGEQLFDA